MTDDVPAKPLKRHQELSDIEIDQAQIDDLRDAYRTLRAHHVAETTALISKHKGLAQKYEELSRRCEEMLAKSSHTLATSRQIVESAVAILFAPRAADPADPKTFDHLSDEELTTWAKQAGIYREDMVSTYLRMVVDELRERRDAEAMFVDADLQLQRIAGCEMCAGNMHDTADEHCAIIKRWRIAQGALCALARIHRGYLRRLSVGCAEGLDAPDESDPR